MQTIKTLLHETTHSILHDSDKLPTREVMETEAESVAYVVMTALGLDSADYSFEYLSSWATIKELKASETVIGETAEKFIKQLIAA